MVQQRSNHAFGLIARPATTRLFSAGGLSVSFQRFCIFGFLGACFAFRHQLPATARRWLAAALFVGLLLGIAQQVRGAHYMSHTLWTGWICWACAAAIDSVVSLLQKRSPAQAQVPDLSIRRP